MFIPPFEEIERGIVYISLVCWISVYIIFIKIIEFGG